MCPVVSTQTGGCKGLIMIGIEDARAIVYGLDAGWLARLAFRSASVASDDSADLRVAVVLDLVDGRVRIMTWYATDRIEWPQHLVSLAYADTATVEDAARRIGTECVLCPSGDVMEESVARAASRIGVSWKLVEAQLRRAYGVAA